MLNNGLCSPELQSTKGSKTRRSVSSLFIIAAETLAISNADIQGLKIGKEEFKLVQYAEDLTVFVPNTECTQLVFRLLD